jgi:tetratricopeptide (TPR) repeat protein
MAGASLAATRAIEADAAGLAAEPSFVRSVARLATGDLEGALADAETAVTRLPSDDWYLAQRSRVRIARGELRAAAEDLLDVLRRYPASPVAQDALAALARRAGDPERARRIEQAARARPGGRLPAYLASKGAPWAAPAPEPGPWAAPLARAEAALASGDAEAAIREASVALGLSPACARAHAVRAEAFRSVGRDADAALDLRWAALLGGEGR